MEMQRWELLSNDEVFMTVVHSQQKTVFNVRTFSLFLTLLGVGLIAFSTDAVAQRGCSGDAIGLSRTWEVPATSWSRFGTFNKPGDDLYKDPPLQEKEVILTFDDGPREGLTNRILDTLKEHCTKATFFVVGKAIERSPELVRRAYREGHTIGTHTYSHQRLNRLSEAEAEEEVERGIEVTRKALEREPGASRQLKFFRFPDLDTRSSALRWLGDRKIASFSADVSGHDWIARQTAKTTFDETMWRLERRRRGILLFHDISPATAEMLPYFLKALKEKGYRVVHMVPER
jgi:peptidoglycan-N-acetylglucosamine deacetylase